MFIGTPILEQISPTELRITGVSLPRDDGTGSGSNAATIGFATATGPAPELVLPASFVAPSATFDNAPVSLATLVEVSVTPDGIGGHTNLQPSVQKTGTDPESFRIAISNTSTSLPTQTLEIYLVFRGQARAGAAIFVEIQNSPNATVNLP